MTSDDPPLVTWRTTEHATCSRHRKYALDCSQFDSLLERSQGCCELCGLEGSHSAWGLLHIDHEHQVGTWAVRGLLCDGCNARLQRGRRLPDTPPLRRYLENSWYRRELERLGLSADLPPEPGLGSYVRCGGRSWVRLDAEVAECWGSRHGKAQVILRSWRAIWYEGGPFHFRVTSERHSLHKSDLSFYRVGLSLLKYIKKHRAADPAIDFYTGGLKRLADTRRPGSRTPADDLTVSERERAARIGPHPEY